MITRKLLLALVVSSMSGCMVGPDYQRPEVGLPASYRTHLAEPFSEVAGPWWGQFGSPTLTSLVNEGLRGNLDLQRATARIDQFRGQLRTVRAGLFPQLGLGGGAKRALSDQFVDTPLAGFDGVGNQYQAGLNASWEIDLWGKLRRQSEAATAQLLGAQYAQRGVALSLASSISEGYLNLLALDEQLSIAEQTAQARKEALDIFQKRYDRGVIRQIELSQAQNDYWSTQATIPPLRAKISSAENSLSVLLGRNPGPIVRSERLSALRPPTAPDVLPATLLSRRPDLLQAEQAVVASNAMVGAAQALYLPDLNLSGMIGFSRGESGQLFESASKVWNLALGLNQTVFDAGAISGQVLQAKSEYQQSVLAYKGAVQSALADVNDALVGTRESAAQLAAVEQQVTALQTYSLQARRLYEGGYSTYLDVTTSEEKLFDGQLQEVNSRLAALNAFNTLYLAVGGEVGPDASLLFGPIVNR
ncbi:efflux transporter outer membrane subunit [Pseudomonas nicosulfuronedens]|uniref:Efflux transporter outer membrane subunit n=1 Tax=Pseudomonas nicosulfuronedens TaxID=2571105 RepID=A0A5R9R718_9PSED|nr:efflux transporter outer membrane subunit [Pseudomonas nicosulfuronedens]MDH1009713.1 efflux transporter outer membrane subunit [Pseudomonas nicosulfuronedens]MDH1981012.1 efflux transporter outer membrane subunit [Pseudomonas nicosulfuronedens]MDH2027727.1 efflux transporter outer membrane subunit [Pseudomonas nicosulfuronedens]TLX78634.1 efflux transporter outer membrane subunit [Pseudomonas nicosulfuronedens]